MSGATRMDHAINLALRILTLTSQRRHNPN